MDTIDVSTEDTLSDGGVTLSYCNYNHIPKCFCFGIKFVLRHLRNGYKVKHFQFRQVPAWDPDDESMDQDEPQGVHRPSWQVLRRDQETEPDRGQPWLQLHLHTQVG